jgi:hypothetical protein
MGESQALKRRCPVSVPWINSLLTSVMACIAEGKKGSALENTFWSIDYWKTWKHIFGDKRKWLDRCGLNMRGPFIM